MPLTTIDAAWYILSALIVLVLPGAAWLVWLPGSKSDPLERLADAVGISISLAALFGLIAFYIGIHWVNETFLNWAALGLLLVFVIGLLARLPSRSTDSVRRRWMVVGGSLLGLIVLIGSILWRLVQARSLVLPAWVDSVHHTLVVRIILERGGVPVALDPYIPASFSYHYGFHLIAALFSTWARSLPAETLLWFGQVINALVALSVYRLAKAVWQDVRPAAAAAILVGFAFHMPAYYLTWGRYTLLTGLVLLPLAMTAAMQVARKPARRGDWLRLVLLTAGVALSHYTTLLLLGFFIILLLVVGLIERLADRRKAQKEAAGDAHDAIRVPPTVNRTVLDGLWQPASGALLGLLLAVPWLARVWQQSGSQADLRLISPLDGGQLEYGRYILYLLGPRHNEILLCLAGLGLILAFFWRASRPLAAWGLLLALLTLPWGLRLDPFRPDHMAIILFLPAAILFGALIYGAVKLLARLRLVWLRISVNALLLLAVLALAVWGAWGTRDVLNPVTVFTDEADVAALTWVDQNTPEDARFLINTASWMGSIYRGVDGGYWLLPVTGRQSLLPPVLYTTGSPDYIEQVNSLAERASRLTACDNDFWSLVRDGKATFVYIHEGQGGLQPAALTNCSGLVPVYRRDGVYIYEIN